MEKERETLERERLADECLTLDKVEEQELADLGLAADFADVTEY